VNRQQRRAAKAQNTSRALAEGLKTVTRESGGVVQIYVLEPEDQADLMIAAVLGDKMAAVLESGLQSLIQNAVRAADTSTPMLCASCPETIADLDFNVVLAIPDCDKPTRSMGMAVCRNCATTKSVAGQKAIQALRCVWPNSRQFVPTHATGGRA
jgi:hypothetical protein